MTTVLVLAAGGGFSEEGGYPIILTERDGRPLAQWIVERCRAIEDGKIVVAIRKHDAHRHHLDSVMSLLAPDASILLVPDRTRGAACTALFAIDYLDTDEDVLVVNGNEMLDADYGEIVREFKRRGLDGGTVIFNSVHPRYSYVALDAEGLVTEVAEKNPISRFATVGMYWFAHGSEFVEAVRRMIRKDASVNGLFYIAPSYNELVLQHKQIGVIKVEPRQYLPIKDMQQQRQFETPQGTRSPA